MNDEGAYDGCGGGGWMKGWWNGGGNCCGGWKPWWKPAMSMAPECVAPSELGIDRGVPRPMPKLSEGVCRSPAWGW